MNPILRLFPLIFLFFLADSLQAQNRDAATMLALGKKRFSVSSGMVKYQVSGNASGTEVLYWDHFGWREARHKDQTIKMMGIETPDHSLALLDGEEITNVNLTTNTGTVMQFSQLSEIADQSDEDLAAVGERMLKQMGGKVVGTEVLLGKTCTVYEIKNLGTKTWIWEGIPLKTITNMMGMEINVEATAVETNIKVPADKMQVPAGVKITEMSSLPGLP
ncbi:MAG: hypothetical protein AAF570_09620, partial [Bacteroidota bacterium]